MLLFMPTTVSVSLVDSAPFTTSSSTSMILGQLKNNLSSGSRHCCWHEFQIFLPFTTPAQSTHSFFPPHFPQRSFPKFIGSDVFPPTQTLGLHSDWWSKINNTSFIAPESCSQREECKEIRSMEPFGDEANRPFYSCVLSCLAIEWKWGWSWPCFDRNLTAFVL